MRIDKAIPALMLGLILLAWLLFWQAFFEPTHDTSTKVLFGIGSSFSIGVVGWMLGSMYTKKILLPRTISQLMSASSQKNSMTYDTLLNGFVARLPVVSQELLHGSETFETFTNRLQDLVFAVMEENSVSTMHYMLEISSFLKPDLQSNSSETSGEGWQLDMYELISRWLPHDFPSRAALLDEFRRKLVSV